MEHFWNTKSENRNFQNLIQWKVAYSNFSLLFCQIGPSCHPCPSNPRRKSLTVTRPKNPRQNVTPKKFETRAGRRRRTRTRVTTRRRCCRSLSRSELLFHSSFVSASYKSYSPLSSLCLDSDFKIFGYCHKHSVEIFFKSVCVSVQLTVYISGSQPRVPPVITFSDL